MQSEIKITTSIEKEKWTKFVDDNVYGNIFQTPEMREVIQNTKGMEPISLFAIDNQGDILASVLAFLSRERGGIFESVATRAVIYGGPIFTNNEKGDKSITALMDQYDEIASKKAMFTEIRMLYDIPRFSVLKNFNYGHEDHLNFLLDLNQSEKEIWKGIQNSKKRGIKKAQKSGSEVVEVRDKKDIRIAYSLLNETYRRVSIPLADRSFFESVFNMLEPLGRFKAFLVRHNDKAIATRILLTYKDRVYDWYNGSLEESFPLYPNDLSEWHAIKWSMERGYKLFDFCGAGKPHKDYGPREFKRRFGGRLVNFGRYLRVYHPIRLNIAKVGYNIYRRAFIK